MIDFHALMTIANPGPTMLRVGFCIKLPQITVRMINAGGVAYNQAAFPHITLQLGSALGDENCPAIRCVVDTATTLSTGNLHFFATLAKAYPHTVASIHSPSDYSPITLSGIVQHDGNSVTTKLSVTFRFHLPYLRQEGNPTSFLVATGCDVTVNAILGLPFIQQTKMIIDTVDQVAKLCALDAPPFSH
jgi:hypothetical protein